MVYISLLAGVGYINQQTQLERCRAPQMAHGLPLLPAVKGQGEVYWLVLLIWCKQNANLLMVTSATALLLVRHLCSDPVPVIGGQGGEGGGCALHAERPTERVSLQLSAPCWPADLDQHSGRFITTHRQVITWGIQLMTANKQINSRGRQKVPSLTLRERSKVRTECQRMLIPLKRTGDVCIPLCL